MCLREHLHVSFFGYYLIIGQFSVVGVNGPGKRGPPPSLKYSAFASFCIFDMLCSLAILFEL